MQTSASEVEEGHSTVVRVRCRCVDLLSGGPRLRIRFVVAPETLTRVRAPRAWHISRIATTPIISYHGRCNLMGLFDTLRRVGPGGVADAAPMPAAGLTSGRAGGLVERVGRGGPAALRVAHRAGCVGWSASGDGHGRAHKAVAVLFARGGLVSTARRLVRAVVWRASHHAGVARRVARRGPPIESNAAPSLKPLNTAHAPYSQPQPQPQS
jgi:hypothetical protein